MATLTIANYKPRKGAVSKLRSMTQLSGYVPDEVRIKSLLSAGLIKAAAADEYYDGQFDYDGLDVPPVPPLPRGFPSGFLEIAEAAEVLRARSEVINERVRIAAEAGKLKKRPFKPANNEAPPPEVNPDEAPPGDEEKG